VIHSSFDAGTDPALKMRQPTTYVKAAAQRFAFKKIPAPPCGQATAGFFICCIPIQFGSFISYHLHLNRQNFFLLSHYRSPGSRVS
jgi:hypothetical protein